jgi:hypothetical protein
MIVFGQAKGQNRDRARRMASRRLRHRIESPSYAENYSKARPAGHTGLRLREADDDSLRGLRAMGGLNKVKQVGYLDSRIKTPSTSAVATSLLELRETPSQTRPGPTPRLRVQIKSPKVAVTPRVDTPLRHLVHYVLSPFDNAQWEVRMPVWNGPLAPMRIHGTQIR